MARGLHFGKRCKLQKKCVCIALYSYKIRIYLPCLPGSKSHNYGLLVKIILYEFFFYIIKIF